MRFGILHVLELGPSCIPVSYEMNICYIVNVRNQFTIATPKFNGMWSISYDEHNLVNGTFDSSGFDEMQVVCNPRTCMLKNKLSILCYNCEDQFFLKNSGSNAFCSVSTTVKSANHIQLKSMFLEIVSSFVPSDIVDMIFALTSRRYGWC